MMHIVSFVLFTMLLFLLSGCSSIIRWAKSEVPQIRKEVFDVCAITPYLKNIRFYDQFSSVFLCDVLRISRSVSTVYLQLYQNRVKPRQKEFEKVLATEIELEKKYITFFMLIPYNIFLERQNEWKIMLEINSEIFHPLLIELVDLSPEYRLIFGTYYSPLKHAYKIVFEKPGIVTEQTSITLRFSNALGEYKELFPACEKSV